MKRQIITNHECDREMIMSITAEILEVVTGSVILIAAGVGIHYIMNSPAVVMLI